MHWLVHRPAGLRIRDYASSRNAAVLSLVACSHKLGSPGALGTGMASQSCISTVLTQLSRAGCFHGDRVGHCLHLSGSQVWIKAVCLSGLFHRFRKFYVVFELANIHSFHTTHAPWFSIYLCVYVFFYCIHTFICNYLWLHRSGRSGYCSFACWCSAFAVRPDTRTLLEWCPHTSSFLALWNTKYRSNPNNSFIPAHTHLEQAVERWCQEPHCAATRSAQVIIIQSEWIYAARQMLRRPV